jgi:YcaO-like protein with predicted kinase domain
MDLGPLSKGAIVCPTEKRFLEGTHRTITPRETTERVQALMPRMGITRVANVTGLDRIGIPVVMVCRPNSRALAVSQGKGIDLAAAKASGLMEAVESYHAERIDLPLKLGSFEDLRSSHRLVDVAQLPRTSRSVYHPYLLMLWIEGFDLLHQEAIWVPFELVHLNYTITMRSAPQAFFPSSNGLASGNALVEAVSQAICEVVERDATNLWWLLTETSRSRTRLDLSTIDDLLCLNVLEKYYRAGVLVAIWDITSDIGIPAFRCEIAEAEPDPLHPVAGAGGMGCHPARNIALLRALTEAAQSRLTFIAGSRDDMPRAKYVTSLDSDSIEAHHSRLVGEKELRDYRTIPNFENSTFEADLAWELECLRSAGLGRVVVVDLSRAEFGIPIVRVVVPGLEMLPDLKSGYVSGTRAARVALQQSGMLPIWSDGE